MKLLSDLLYATLSTESSITDIVGTDIYPNLADQDAGDYYVVFAIAADTETNREEGDFDGSVQIEVYGVAYETTLQLSEAVSVLLSNQDMSDEHIVASVGRVTESLDEAPGDGDKHVKVLQMQVWGEIK